MRAGCNKNTSTNPATYRMRLQAMQTIGTTKKKDLQQVHWYMVVRSKAWRICTNSHLVASPCPCRTQPCSDKFPDPSGQCFTHHPQRSTNNPCLQPPVYLKQIYWMLRMLISSQVAIRIGQWTGWSSYSKLPLFGTEHQLPPCYYQELELCPRALEYTIRAIFKISLLVVSLGPLQKTSQIQCPSPIWLAFPQFGQLEKRKSK